MGRFKKAIKKATKTVTKTVKKATKPAANLGRKLRDQAQDRGMSALSDPKSLFSVKNVVNTVKEDLGNVSSAVSTVNQALINTNPLNSTLQDFNMKGKKAGGIGRYLGGLGETVRKKPVETIAVVYGAVAAFNSLSATETVEAGVDASEMIAEEIGTEASGEIAAEVAANSGNGVVSTLTQAGSKAVGAVAKTAAGTAGKIATAAVAKKTYDVLSPDKPKETRPQPQQYQFQRKGIIAQLIDAIFGGF